MAGSADWPATFERLAGDLDRLRPMVDAFVTTERVLRYLTAIEKTPGPSTAASAMRGPVLRDLWRQDGASLSLDADFRNSGSAAVLTGAAGAAAALWYFAHLDTISYLVGSRHGAGYALVPFCYHLVRDGSRQAQVYRFDLQSASYGLVAEGTLVSTDGVPRFMPCSDALPLGPGDRVVPVTTMRQVEPGGFVKGHFDNAGGVAALAVAAPVLAEAGIAALCAFPDEEEGPHGGGNQMMSRGTARIIANMATPDMAVEADMQQAGSRTRIGGGAVRSEFASLARGAVTPPHLYAALDDWSERLAADFGVRIQESSGSYTSRSDDVSLMLRTPDIVLLGFPGLNRHFDNDDPSAHLGDLLDLAKALVYVSALAPVAASLRARISR